MFRFHLKIRNHIYPTLVSSDEDTVLVVERGNEPAHRVADIPKSKMIDAILSRRLLGGATLRALELDPIDGTSIFNFCPDRVWISWE